MLLLEPGASLLETIRVIAVMPIEARAALDAFLMTLAGRAVTISPDASGGVNLRARDEDETSTTSATYLRNASRLKN
jgi:hypothetical protein